MGATPPGECPVCGGTDWSKRYSTGGGWRVVAFVCTACGHRESAT